MQSPAATSVSPSGIDENPRSTMALVLSVSIQVFICVWTILANGLVLVTVFGSRKLRSTMTSFLLSLAVADFLLGLAMIMSVAITLWTPPFWPCLVTYCILTGQSVASVWSLMGVAVDRYLHVVGLLATERTRLRVRLSGWRISELYAHAAIVIIWVGSVVTATVPVFLRVRYSGTSSATGFVDGQSCVDFTALFPTAYIEYIFYGNVFVPVVIMAVIYSHIIGILLKRMRRVAPQEGNDISGGCGKLQLPENVNQSAVKSRQELKVVVKLVLLLTVFCICMFPMTIGILFELYDPEYKLASPVRLATVALAYFNSAMNPVLYWFFKAQFRKCCSKLLRGCFDSIATTCRLTRCCPRRPNVPGRSLRDITARGLNDPSAVPTIHLSTYHCDEGGCKRTYHRENIASPPQAMQHSENSIVVCVTGQEDIPSHQSGMVFVLPGNVVGPIDLDEDKTELEDSSRF